MTPRDPLSSLRSPRIPFEKEVKLKFERFTGFIEEYCSNISPGGMFIRMESPPPTGTVLGFEVRLSDDYRLIKGRGEVVWARANGDGPERPAGVGIRFQEIDPLGKSLIYRIMEEHIKGGGVPFDPDAKPEGVSGQPPPTVVPREKKVEPVAEVFAAAVEGDELLSPIPDMGEPHVTESDVVEPDALELSAAPALAADPVSPSPASTIPSDLLRSEPVPEPKPVPLPEAPPPRPMPRGGARAKRNTRPWLLTALAATMAVVLVAAGFFWFRWRTPDSPEAPTVEDPVTQPEATTPPRAPDAADSLSQTTGEPSAGEVPVEVVLPEPETTTPVESPAPGPAPGAPFTRVMEVAWEVAGGETVLTLTTDGVIPEDRFSTVHMNGGDPRELIRLEGVVEPYRDGRLLAETPQLRQVRVGYHAGQQLHVVADLAGPEIRITRVEHLPSSLRIHLGAP